MRPNWRHLLNNWYVRSFSQSLPATKARGTRRSPVQQLARRPLTRRRGTKRDTAPASEVLEGRTLLAAPVITTNGGNNFSITIEEDAWRHPLYNPDVDFGTNTYPQNGQLAYYDADPIYAGVILEDPNTGLYRNYPVPLTFLNARDDDGDAIRWDLPNGNNPTHDGDSSRAFRIIQEGNRANDDDYAYISGFDFNTNRYIWSIGSLGTDEAALIVNDHYDYGGDGGGYSFYTGLAAPEDFIHAAYDDTDDLANWFDVDGDMFLGTDSDDGGDFNFENQSSLSVTPRAISGNNEIDSITITVNLRDINDAPFIPVDFDDSVNVFYISEHIRQGDFVGDLIVYDEDNSPRTQQNNAVKDDPLQLYEIVNSPKVDVNENGYDINDPDLFVISQNTGQISINPQIDPNLSVAQAALRKFLNYENPGGNGDPSADQYYFYDFYRYIEDDVTDDWYLPLQVRVTDYRDLSDPPFDGRVNLRSRDTYIYIGLSDVSEFAPIVPELELSIDESTPSNNINNRVVGIVRPDPGYIESAPNVVTGTYDRDQFYTFSIDPATNPNNAFTIVPQVDPVTGLAKTAEIRVNNPSAINYEAMTTFTLGVTVTDVGINSQSTRTTVTINVNDLNEATTYPSKTLTLQENSPTGTYVGTASASDVDVFTSDLVYSITDGNQAVILITSGNRAKFQALVPDALQLGDTLTFQGIFRLDTSTGDLFVADNISNDYKLNGFNRNTDLSGVDPQMFLDFEQTPTFNLTMRAEDQGNPDPSHSFDDASVQINLTNIIEGTPNVNDQTFQVNENTANGSLVGNVIATRGQDSTQPLVYTIQSGNIGNTFAINQNTGALTVAASGNLDFETRTSYTLRVRVADSSNSSLFDEALVTVNVRNISEPVTITANQVFSVDENAPSNTSVGTVAITDSDVGQTYTYALLGGNIGGTFAINAATGEITVATNNVLDFETNPTFVLTVRVSDSGNPSFSDTETVTINLNDIEPEPPNIQDKTVSLNEFSANGTVVTTITPASVSQGQQVAYSITGGNTGGAFVINQQSGVITVANQLALDWDDNPQFQLIVRAADAAQPSLFDTAIITVNLNNLDNPPLVNDQTFQVLENSANGTSVGTVVAVDVDDEDTLTYSIDSQTTAGMFTIDPNTGEITVADNTALVEGNSPQTVNVRVTDDSAGPLSDTAVITIGIFRPNTAPVLNDVTFTLDEHVDDGTVVGTLVATDGEAPPQTLTYTILSGNALAGFALDPNTGVITVADSAVIDFSRNPVFTLQVQVQDDGNGMLTDTATVTIRLNEFDGPIEMSPMDQLVLELINRARRDPGAEARRLGLPQSVINQMSQIPPGSLQPLAPNQFLNNASLQHSTNMIVHDFFSHIDQNDENFDERAFEEGFDASIIAENIDYVLTGGGMLTNAQRTQLINDLHRRLLSNTVSRSHILDARYREAGIGVEQGAFTNGQGQTNDVLMLTELLGVDNASGPYITGVVYRDANDQSATDDGFYSLGEQISTGFIRAVNVATNQVYERDLSTSGGYSLRVPNGTYNVSYWSGTHDSDETYVQATVVVNGKNVKVDFETTTAPQAKAGITGFVNGNIWVGSDVTGTWTAEHWARWPVSSVREFVQGDFNGDGLQDVAGWLNNGDWQVGLSDGRGNFTYETWTTWRTNDIKDIQVGDFNGDGRDDLAALFETAMGTANIWVAQSTGNGFAASVFGAWYDYDDVGEVAVGDFDGNGIDDLGIMTSLGSWWTYRSNGSSFNAQKWTTWNVDNGLLDVQVGDFTGDGKTDIAGLFGTPIANRYNWWVGRSAPAQKFVNRVWGTWTINGTVDEIVSGDFNGDGKTDIAGLFNGQHWWVNAANATSSGFNISKWATWSFATGGLRHMDVYDINGDGRDDLVGFSTNGPEAGYWNVGIAGVNNFNTRRTVMFSSTANWSHFLVGGFVAPAMAQGGPAAPSSSADEFQAFGDASLLDLLQNV